MTSAELDTYPRAIDVGPVRLVIWHCVDTDYTRTWHWAAHCGSQHMGMGEARNPEAAEQDACECARLVVA